MKWDEAAVEAAIRALPARTDGEAPDVATALEMIKVGVWDAQCHTVPGLSAATQKQTMKELETLCKLCCDLHNHIMEMHSPALRMVEKSIQDGSEEWTKKKGKRPLYHPSLLAVQLAGMAAAANTGWLETKSGDHSQLFNLGAKKPGARDVTFACARVFESVTGGPPGRSFNTYTGKEGGPFLDFLRAIFAALGVSAKPAGQVKLLLEKRAAKTA